MPLIYCKVKLKLRWTKHCVLSVLSAANTDDDDRQGKNYISLVCLSAIDNQKLSKRFSKGGKYLNLLE